ncbi:MAG: ribosome small subunit-dependent GTPase A [Spirochaetes bacterium GWD1_61_31]|nr:MAG: ribosome small subunit-dependent GTPase A [Spirochaetes bacterium GWB1_60_80]OHD32683.1 MAG: ribosome small subunit-dependent GTPase A [Spirochaetes bacterium GWC1_61_12]OHD42074.1 MAG: ribosome small subunit-dependent GTPase A [Spirochaetes bacterium GWE1_60_18]OHD43355.1 MAG: ribosome small subunit-dependent GTPase A [Spirochaetes bacterium GWD1_61_31]OHD60992.1 MAG: ribosome small subunit-dependent GTPase A [Spirochaetes bacterium GWF1_60_12]HAP43240.1 ribosome small subunit-depende
MNGVVVAGSNNVFDVRAADGRVCRCSLKGKKLKTDERFYNPLTAGDEVTWEQSSPDAGVITGLQPRRSLFWRYNEKGKARQAIAANMDVVLCVASAGMPPFRPRFIDRVSLEPVAAKLPFVLVLNKADLGIDDELAARLVDYRRIGFEIMVCSVETGDGIDQLRARIDGKQAAFVGQSGVGKSSLLNAMEAGLGLRVGEVCEKFERGRHTTVAAVLVHLADGVTRVIDTPGVRRFAIRGIDPLELPACFPELQVVQTMCQHGARCLHQDEAGCGIERAIKEGIMHADRYESYSRILYELQDTVQYEKAAGRPRPDYWKDDKDEYDYE